MARFYAPTTIFIDEVDSIGSKRGEMNECESSRRVKAELLVQMDGVTSSSSAGANEESEEEKRKIVMVLGATNRPWDLDEALRRRFEKRVYIPLPVEKGREELFKLNLKSIPLADDVDFKKLIKDTAGYSGCDIANICREAAYMPMRKKLLNAGVDDILSLINKPELKNELEIPLCQDDFDQALNNISKSVSENDLKDFETWAKDFKSI
jgi:katanin p60 ATPase-containing subunit A1